MWKNYVNAVSINDALKVLNEKGNKARIVAGSTDLMLEIERGQWPQVDTLIDVSRVSVDKDVYTDNDDYIHISPVTTHNQCLNSRIIREKAPLLAQAIWQIGSPQIRNRGTVAGNLATASPANDTIAPLMALKAVITLSSVSSGHRDVELKDFYTGVRRTVIKPDEMITDIKYKAQKNNQRGVFLKYALRNAQAISVVNLALLFTIEGNKIIGAVITMGSVAPTIIHAKDTEAYLKDKNIDQEMIEDVAEKISVEAKPIDDIRGSAKFRTAMVKALAKKGLELIYQDAKYDPIPLNPVLLSNKNNGFHSRLPETTIHSESTEIITKINGKEYIFKTGQEKSLLRLIREEAGLIGSKEGCAEGECGACTLFLDGEAVMSCMVPAPRAHGANIKTIEAISDDEKLHPLQEAFIEEGAVQCGYCTPGFIMSGVKLLEEVEDPSQAQIKEAFAGNLCRCTGYYKIINAVENAAGKIKEDVK